MGLVRPISKAAATFVFSPLFLSTCRQVNLNIHCGVALVFGCGKILNFLIDGSRRGRIFNFLINGSRHGMIFIFLIDGSRRGSN